MTTLHQLHSSWESNSHTITPQQRRAVLKRFTIAIHKSNKEKQELALLEADEQENFTKAVAQTRSKPFTLDGKLYVAFLRAGHAILREFPTTKEARAAVEPRLAYRLKLLLSRRENYALRRAAATTELHSASCLMVLTFGNHHATVDGVIYDPACSRKGLVYFIPRRTGSPTDAIVHNTEGTL